MLVVVCESIDWCEGARVQWVRALCFVSTSRLCGVKDEASKSCCLCSCCRVVVRPEYEYEMRCRKTLECGATLLERRSSPIRYSCIELVRMSLCSSLLIAFDSEPSRLVALNFGFVCFTVSNNF